MAVSIFKRPLKIVSNDQFVRVDSDYFRLIDIVKKELKELKLECEPLRKNITHIETGKPITRKDYSNKPTKCIHLVVRNIERGQLNLEDPIYLREEKGEELQKHKLIKGDLVLAISSNVGSCFLYDGSFPETQFTLSHYLIKARFNEEKVVPQFLVYYLNSTIMKNYFRACETGKTQMNLSKQYLYELPFPKIDKDEQETIAKKMKLADDEIAQLEKKVPNTQEVIQRVFEDMLGYIPSEEYITKGSVFFRQSLQRIGRGKYIRSGARYSFFWNKYNGLIFETKKQFEPSELGKLMRPHKTTIFKKGFLPQRYILIDKEDIEPKTGVIMNEEYVEKIESSKVLFGDSDILVSKIDPFLGHVILNEKEKPFIGTTELVPYIINKEKAYLKFIQYVLLSKNFLNLSEKIMAGKRQPRIMPYELLELKIPLPPRTLQEEAAKKIEKEIGDLKAQKTEIENAMKKRETSFIEYLRNSGHQPKGNSLIEKAYQPKK